jgi:hypothetical protein
MKLDATLRALSRELVSTIDPYILIISTVCVCVLSVSAGIGVSM